MKSFLSRYKPAFVSTIVYMLQVSEYRLGDYLKWLWSVNNFDTVRKRGQLKMTTKVKLLIAISYSGIFATLVACTLLMLSGGWGIVIGLFIILLLPWLVAHALIVSLWLGEAVVQRPKQRKLKERSRDLLAKHPATKIAIAGSFGKTSAKEIATTVLSESKRVAATPGNMNTLIGTCHFIETLQGDEEIIIFELGESHVGDIHELCELVEPDIGIITGINEAHLSTFGTIENTVATIFELRDYLGDKPLYLNAESKLVRQNMPKGPNIYAYGHLGVNGWKVSDVDTSIRGTHFSIDKGTKVIWARTALIGEHHLGILAATVDISDKFGLSASEITEGMSRVAPFMHRMAPYQLHDAWIIDDTYNGNIEGVEAGLAFLASVDAERKVYVTPGLVEQGDSTEALHVRIGEQAAKSADVVVLMKNSVTDHIVKGLHRAEYGGRVIIVDDPLKFYRNINHFVAAGDVVLMQNDWTDNYR